MVKDFPWLSSFEDKFYESMQRKKRIAFDALKSFFSLKLGVTGKIMKSLVSEDWVNNFLNPATPGSTLFADIDRDQQTSSVKNKTVLIKEHCLLQKGEF